MTYEVCLRYPSYPGRLRQIWAQRREVHTNLLTCMEEDLPSSREVAMQHLKVHFPPSVVPYPLLSREQRLRLGEAV